MSFLFASINATAEAEPSAVNFRWQVADGAVYYDLYEKNDFIIRLSSDVLSYRKNNLQSDTEFHTERTTCNQIRNTVSQLQQGMRITTLSMQLSSMSGQKAGMGFMNG